MKHARWRGRSQSSGTSSSTTSSFSSSSLALHFLRLFPSCPPPSSDFSRRCPSRRGQKNGATFRIRLPALSTDGTTGTSGSMGAYEEKKEACGTVCLKYLLFTFNFLFWLAGGVVMAVGIWTLLEKSDYISLLSSKTYAASAYILVLAGAIVMVTGVLGCCATFKEQRRLLRVGEAKRLSGEQISELQVEIDGPHTLLEDERHELRRKIYQMMSFSSKQTGQQEEEDRQKERQLPTLKLALNNLPTGQKLVKPRTVFAGKYFVLLLCIFLLEILAGVLAYIYYQQFKCCGSNSSADWASSIWIRSRDSDNREVPDSCCKSPTELCGRRSHPSNIYKVEIIGMVFTCCLYRSLKAEPY
ncbi:hypothetical protein F2P81_004224 [Scophthalmus maximus]|uniref:Uncharacterized protein n=1 Tax=Scophthalmus maximus TaxID=52904 RepID=A0A6A4T953_SCOMX|nr:hypothetical protein F2P81_004224 [Scophthalmus maximus]